MATVREEIVVRAEPALAWDAARDWGALHTRLVPGFVTDCAIDGAGDRTITFFNGAVARESMVTLDDDARRLAYTVAAGAVPFRHYHAVLEVFPHETGARLVWTVDLLPDEYAGPIGEMMRRGAAAMRTAFGTP